MQSSMLLPIECMVHIYEFLDKAALRSLSTVNIFSWR